MTTNQKRSVEGHCQQKVSAFSNGVPVQMLDMIFILLAAVMVMSEWTDRSKTAELDGVHLAVLPPIALTKMNTEDTSTLSGSENEKPSISVKNGSQGSVLSYCGEPIDAASLEAKLKEETPEELLLFVESDVPFEEISRVMHVCVSSGVGEVMFGGEQDEKGERK